MNWPRFVSMGGYAVYVWGSYTLTLLAMGGEVLLLLLRHKKARRDDINTTVCRGNGQG